MTMVYNIEDIFLHTILNTYFYIPMYLNTPVNLSEKKCMDPTLIAHAWRIKTLFCMYLLYRNADKKKQFAGKLLKLTNVPKMDLDAIMICQRLPSTSYLDPFTCFSSVINFAECFQEFLVYYNTFLKPKGPTMTH